MLCHEMLIKTLVHREKINYAEIIDYEYEIGKAFEPFYFED